MVLSTEKGRIICGGIKRRSKERMSCMRIVWHIFAIKEPILRSMRKGSYIAFFTMIAHRCKQLYIIPS